MSIKQAAKALIEKLDTLSSRDPQWEYQKELDALRKAIHDDDTAIREWRKQFCETGGIQAAQSINYEVWN